MCRTLSTEDFLCLQSTGDNADLSTVCHTCFLLILSPRTTKKERLFFCSKSMCRHFSMPCSGRFDLFFCSSNNELTRSAQRSFQCFVKIRRGDMKQALKTNQLRNIPSNNKINVALLIQPHVSTERKRRGGERERERRGRWE